MRKIKGDAKRSYMKPRRTLLVTMLEVGKVRKAAGSTPSDPSCGWKARRVFEVGHSALSNRRHQFKNCNMTLLTDVLLNLYEGEIPFDRTHGRQHFPPIEYNFFSSVDRASIEWVVQNFIQEQ